MAAKLPKFIAGIFIAAVIVMWLLSGIYTVKSGEEAVVLRFGKHVNTVADAGLNWHIPGPVENVVILNVTEPKRLEFGYSTVVEGSTAQAATYNEVPHQALMLTADENLVKVETAIQYIITNIEDYVFNVDDQEGSLIIASESAIRRVVANHVLDEVLTDNKFVIQQEIKDDLQAICDSYGFGISIVAAQLQDVNAPDEVDASFKDVANAKEDKTSYINEAQSYSNEVIPKARGNAAEMVNKASAYKEKRTAEARGDVANFVQILEKYQLGKEVTRTRMYLETMEEILPGIKKFFVNGAGDLVKFLPLQDGDGSGSGTNTIVIPKDDGGTTGTSSN